MRLTQSTNIQQETYKQEIAHCNALMKAAREGARRSAQSPVDSLSTKVKVTAIVVHILSGQDNDLTRLFCQTRLMSKHHRVHTLPTSKSYKSLDFLLKKKKLLEKADKAVNAPLDNHSYAQAAQFIAESKVHDWLLRINTGGNGPSSQQLADTLIQNWPWAHRCPTLMAKWRSKLANPHHLSVWASQFRRHWLTKWQAKSHTKHIDLETSRFRAYAQDLAHTSLHFWRSKTRPVF